MSNYPDPFHPDDGVEEAAYEEEAVEFAVKLNREEGTYECALCGNERGAAVGPELYLAGTWELVCDACGRERAPLLAALIELAGAADMYAAVRWQGQADAEPPDES